MAHSDQWTQVLPMVLVAKFISKPSALSSHLCTIQPALFIFHNIYQSRIKPRSLYFSLKMHVLQIFCIWRVQRVNLPAHSEMDTSSWRPRQTPRLGVFGTCRQYEHTPPAITCMSLFHWYHVWLEFISNPPTVFSDTEIISDFASSALFLSLHIMWTVPPGHTKIKLYLVSEWSLWWEDSSVALYTFLGYSYGCRFANSTVSSSNHERSTHNRHIKVLGLKGFRSGLKSLP